METRVILPEALSKFISDIINTGKYKNENEFIVSAVNMLMTWELSVAELGRCDVTNTDVGVSKERNRHRELLEMVEEYLGRNSSRVTGTKSW